MYLFIRFVLLLMINIKHLSGMLQSLKIWGAGSNAARRRCPVAPSDLPKSGEAASPPATPASNMPAHMYGLPTTVFKIKI